MPQPNIDLEKLMQKVTELKKSGKVDLSTEEDLSIAIMNLISLEEHFFFSAEKTGGEDYFGMLGQIREVRKTLLAKMMDKNEGESWCISKHLLAATMRMMEVGTKLQTDGKKEESREMFHKAYEVYSMFWALRFKIIDASQFKKVAEDEKLWTYKDIVSKLVDCCDE